jgi:hypothetical protein
VRRREKKTAVYWGIHPIILSASLLCFLKNKKLFENGGPEYLLHM